MIGASASIHTVAERTRGFRHALRAKRVRDERSLLCLDIDGSRDAQAAVARLLDRAERPTALFTLNNPCTIGAARALRERDLSHRIALLGFDDFALADMLQPP